MELALGVAGGLDGRAAGSQPHRERGSWSGRSGLGQLITTERLAGGPDRIQRVGLGAVAAGGALWPVQFDHLLGVGGQRPGQPGPIATGALDRPHPRSGVLVGQLKELLVADRGSGHGQRGQDLAGRCGQNRGGVGVLVGVDADDDLDGVCQHGHALCSLPGDDVVGAGPGRSTAGL
jgi:hypothetical protein